MPPVSLQEYKKTPVLAQVGWQEKVGMAKDLEGTQHCPISLRCHTASAYCLTAT